MEKESEQKQNPNGSFVKRETITTTPEDGVVPEQVHRPAALPHETYGEYRYGHSTTKTYSTNDPRVTRAVAWTFCGVFMLIGLLLLVLHRWFFAVLFIGTSIFCFVRANQDINKVAEQLEKQGHDVTIDSPEEFKEVVGGVAGEMKSSFQEVTESTFSQNNLKNFIKISLPFYIGISVLITVLLSVAVSVVLGIFALVMMALSGLFFYCVILKLLTKK